MAGKRWSKIAAALMVAVVLSLTAATGSSAEGESDTGAFNSFRLKASNGYKVIVWAASGKGYRQGRALFLVSSKRDAAGYFVPALVTATTVRADLGDLGAIDVSFRPSGERGWIIPSAMRGSGCVTRRAPTSARSTSTARRDSPRRMPKPLALSLHPFIDFICAGSGEGRGAGFPGAALLVRSKARADRVTLQVNQNRPGARVHLERLDRRAAWSDRDLPRSRGNVPVWGISFRPPATGGAFPARPLRRHGPSFVATPNPRTAGPATSRPISPAAQTCPWPARGLP